MNIRIEFKEQNEMRYNTLGDYFLEGDTLVFQIAKQKIDLHTKLILIHELVEHTLCEHKGITIDEITKFDLEFEEKIDEGLISSDKEPGDDDNSPYRAEHQVAMIVERMMCNHLGINFDTYNDSLTL